MSGLPFTAVEIPWVLDFFHSLKPAYVPAVLGHSALSHWQLFAWHCICASSLACAAVVKYSMLTAGALKLQTSVLTNDYANSKAALDVRLAQEQHISVSIDVWKSDCSQAAYACNVRLADGTTSLLGAQEVSSDADTAVRASGTAHPLQCMQLNVDTARTDSSLCIAIEFICSSPSAACVYNFCFALLCQC